MLWIFCCLVLSCTYLSKMVGHLTIQTFEILPNDLKQVLGMDVKCGFTVIGFIYEIFSTSKNSIFKRVRYKFCNYLWDWINNKVFAGQVYSKMEQFPEQFGCLAKVLGSKDIFVCATYDAVAKLYLLRNGYRLENSPLRGSPKDLFYGPVNIATKSRSRLLPNFHYATQTAVATGLSLRWDEMDLRAKRNAIIKGGVKNRKSANNTEVPSNGDGVKLKHLKGPWYLFGFGLGAASIVWLGERYLSAFRLKSNAVQSL